MSGSRCTEIAQNSEIFAVTVEIHPKKRTANLVKKFSFGKGEKCVIIPKTSKKEPPTSVCACSDEGSLGTSACNVALQHDDDPC